MTLMSPGLDPASSFAPELEAEYVRNRLLDSRTLIRMACLLGLFVIALRLGELSMTGPPRPAPFPGAPILFAGVVVGTSVLLAWVSWSRAFARRYLPMANVAVPVRNAFAAVGIAGMASIGQLELLMLLPVMVLSPFFFLGLHFRPALACVALTCVAFITSALFFAMPPAVVLRSCSLLLVTAATCAVAAWQLEKQSRRSFLEGRLIAQLAELDALTGAKNRRVFDEHLARLWQQAIRDGRGLSILMIDVDHFKAFNDRYGHQAGDAALRRVAQAVQAQICRPLDMLARYGGEEFAVILYDSDADSTRDIAERIRVAVSAMNIEHRGAHGVRVVTVSVGVAAIEPSSARDPRGAVQLADEALYTAKTLGRDRVHMAEASEYRKLETGVFAQQRAAG
ncbi:MAG TPA: GGDEF domain-containing protein [Steroidobacteraceae bacterium]|nr:GGDEF domain-containing protein [Steroidobacteraceae bacterium]